MSDRNWEQELAKIDKQIASVSDEELLAQNKVQRTAGAPPPSAKAPKAAAVPMAPGRSAGSWMAWVQLGLAVAAATGLWFWPWATRCGLNAVAFTGATAGVTLLGLWSAVGSWKHRQSKAHILSFAVMIWGLVLGAREVLPRVGYAIPSLTRPAGWSCDAPTTIAPATNPPATPPSQATPPENPDTRQPSSVPPNN